MNKFMSILTILILMFVGAANGQLDYNIHEIFTYTQGSLPPSIDSVRFWMEAEGPVWNKNLVVGR